MIPKGTRITFDVQGSVGHWIPRSTQGVRQDAIDNITPFARVESLSIARPGFIEDPATFVLGVNWPYESAVRILTQFDHGKIDDLVLVITNAYEFAAGSIPTVTARDWQPNQDPQLDYTGPGLVDDLGLPLLVALVITIVLAVGVGVFAWKVAP